MRESFPDKAPHPLNELKLHSLLFMQAKARREAKGEAMNKTAYYFSLADFQILPVIFVHKFLCLPLGKSSFFSAFTNEQIDFCDMEKQLFLFKSELCNC